jgi:hypothetical protein
MSGSGCFSRHQIFEEKYSRILEMLENNKGEALLYLRATNSNKIKETTRDGVRHNPKMSTDRLYKIILEDLTKSVSSERYLDKIIKGYKTLREKLSDVVFKMRRVI